MNNENHNGASDQIKAKVKLYSKWLTANRRTAVSVGSIGPLSEEGASLQANNHTELETAARELGLFIVYKTISLTTKQGDKLFCVFLLSGKQELTEEEVQKAIDVLM